MKEGSHKAGFVMRDRYHEVINPVETLEKGVPHPHVGVIVFNKRFNG